MKINTNFITGCTDSGGSLKYWCQWSNGGRKIVPSDEAKNAYPSVLADFLQTKLVDAPISGSETIIVTRSIRQFAIAYNVSLEPNIMIRRNVNLERHLLMQPRPMRIGQRRMTSAPQPKRIGTGIRARRRTIIMYIGIKPNLDDNHPATIPSIVLQNNPKAKLTDDVQDMGKELVQMFEIQEPAKLTDDVQDMGKELLQLFRFQSLALSTVSSSDRALPTFHSKRKSDASVNGPSMTGIEKVRRNLFPE